ncbi:hypothetical protein VTH82DRAFT_5148 [Thermothelomyces myriococcoides]
MAPASGPSMLPTFEVLGEWLLVSKLHRFGRGVEVGDVVAYNIPINDEVGVKRVLGLPGDYVLMDTPDGDGMAGGVGGGPNMIQVREGPCPMVIATIRPFSEFKWINNPLKKAGSPSED